MFVITLRHLARCAGSDASPSRVRRRKGRVDDFRSSEIETQAISKAR
jgi:hypothetical protein